MTSSLLHRNPEERKQTLILLGLVIVLGALLAWWIIYYDLTYQKAAEIQEKLDRVIIEKVNEKPELLKHYPELESGPHGYRIKNEVLNYRISDHRRKLVMLITESIFVMIIIGWGSFAIYLGIRRERKLIRERTIFFNSVTHELKTPLSSILLNIQTLSKRKLKDEQRQELLDDSIRNIRRLEEQVNNILLGGEIHRSRLMYTGKMNPGIDVKKEVLQYISANKRDLERSGVQLNHDLQDQVNVAIDKEMFEKILSNLISNAIRYGASDPKIEIVLKIKNINKEKYAILILADNGRGIPPDELDRIFQPFYRLGNDSHAIRGSGLGLYLVKEMIESSGGRISARSEGEGKGSRFEILFPLQENTKT